MKPAVAGHAVHGWQLQGHGSHIHACLAFLHRMRAAGAAVQVALVPGWGAQADLLPAASPPAATVPLLTWWRTAMPAWWGPC